MNEHTKKHLITAALPYANGPLHIGHIAGAYLPADIYVRFKRLAGADVLYICGSDENPRPLKICVLCSSFCQKYPCLTS